MDDVKIAEECAKRALDELERTAAVRINLNKEKPDIFSSKFGGTPYIPHDSSPPLSKYRHDDETRQLRLLAQIDFSDTKHPLLPENGLLQFWIAGDDCWGLPDDFKVIYYETVDHTVTENEVIAKITPFSGMDSEFFPVHGEYGLSFEIVDETFPTDSHEFIQLFLKYYNEATGENWKDTWNMPSKIKYDVLVALNSVYGHKIGGSSDFCQGDPRYDDNYKRNFQLLQISSDFGSNEVKIMWGDAGIGHFFINEEKLKNKDFSDILYYADCC